MTPDTLTVAYVGIGGTLLGAIIGFAGNLLLQRSREAAVDRRAHEAAAAEALTAVALLITSVNAFRAAWGTQKSLIDMGRGHRSLMLDWHTTVLPTLRQAVRPITEVSLWRGRRNREVATAAQDLGIAVAELAESAGRPGDQYATARESYETAIRGFRAALDKPNRRRRGKPTRE
jgi:hypothetical protein